MLNPKTIDKAAPKPAAEEMPSIYYETRGLRKIPCIVAPAAANPAPAIRAMIILGKRIVQIIVSARGDAGPMFKKGKTLENMTIKASLSLGEEAPKLRANNMATINANNKEKITKSFFFFFLL
jgi:hypothetical protein